MGKVAGAINVRPHSDANACHLADLHRYSQDVKPAKEMYESLSPSQTYRH